MKQGDEDQEQDTNIPPSTHTPIPRLIQPTNILRTVPIMMQPETRGGTTSPSTAQSQLASTVQSLKGFPIKRNINQMYTGKPVKQVKEFEEDELSKRLRKITDLSEFFPQEWNDNLRVSVVRKIMSLDPDFNFQFATHQTSTEVENEAVYAISKASEMMMQLVVKNIIEQHPKIIRNEKKNIIKYSHLVRTITKDSRFRFLLDLLPYKER
eukprot:snap_masked-scaffold_20-processed-gene-2.24-mRNA-1 protein AED:1.00 eAED:1.00 QI:0/-1/0/0/-1/1/1/0/209